MLVLASASPRRRELLTLGGFTFTVAPAHIPEERRDGESGIAYVSRLAREKAAFIYEQRPAAERENGLMVLGADTTVVAPDGQILEKPADASDAARMLRLLSGATHQVITGVALVSSAGVEVAAEVTYVTMVTLSDAEIAEYVATGEPMDRPARMEFRGGRRVGCRASMAATST